MAKQELINLLKESTVFLSSSSGEGTGFFIAPNGWILTCDHVVLQSNNIKVSWLNEAGRQEFTAEVKVRLSDPFDIALLKTQQVIPDHKCVYLDDTLPQTGDKLYAFGYPQEYGNTYSGGESITAEYEGQSFQDERLVALKFRSGQIPGGCSGSPLLNLRTGKVCGIIKSAFDSGGRAAPCSLLFQVEKLTNSKNQREIIRGLIKKNSKFHRKDNKTWNKIVKQFYWDRKLALILAIISLICFVLIWQSEIEDRLFLAALRLLISSGFGYAALLAVRSIKLDIIAKYRFIASSFLGFVVTLSVFFLSFLFIVDSSIVIRNLTGINFYPTLGLTENVMPSPLKQVLNINDEPIIDRGSPVYEAVKAFKEESGNSKLSFLSGSGAGIRSAFNRNNNTIRRSNNGVGSKELNNVEKISQTKKDFESEPSRFDTEHQDFYYSSVKMPLQTTREDAYWTSFQPIDQDIKNSQTFGIGFINQYPVLSSIKKIGDFRNTTESNTVNNSWIQKIIDKNPNVRGFLAFSYGYLLNAPTSFEQFNNIMPEGCGGILGITRTAPSPYIRFVDIKNNSFSSMKIQSFRKKIIDKDKYQLTAIFLDRDKIFQDVPAQDYSTSISIPPGSHFFIPTEFGFDTRIFKNKASLQQDSKNSGMSMQFHAIRDIFMSNTYIDWRSFDRKKESLDSLITKTIAKVNISNLLSNPFHQREEILNKIPNRFAVGSLSNLISIRINGEDIQVDNPLTDSHFSMSAYYAYGSCPYLMVYDSEKGYWVDLGNIMVGRQDEKSKDYETYSLGNHPSKFRIEEREQEVTYLNSMSIIYTDSQTKQDRRIQSLIPELSHLDDKYIVLNQNEDLEINLQKILPKNAINVRVQINGYYKVNPGVNIHRNQQH